MQLMRNISIRAKLWLLVAGLLILTVTITAGLAQFSLFTFIWASVLTRGFRFFAVAAILKYFGPAMLAEFEKRMALYGTLGIVALVGLVVAWKVLT